MKPGGDVADMLAIQDLVYNYTHAIDGRQELLFAGLWASDAVWDLGGDAGLGVFRGRDAIFDAFRRSVASGRQMHHFSSNLIVHVHGNQATGRSKSVTTGRDIPMFASYDDEYVRLDGIWQFTRRTVRAHL